jgi:hypothetical protein
VVLRHAFFSGASSRLPSGHVLHHLATIYIVRSVDLWKTEEVRETFEMMEGWNDSWSENVDRRFFCVEMK